MKNTKKGIVFYTKRLEMLMLINGWPMYRLAKELGISSQAVSKYLNGKSKPAFTTLGMMSKVFGVPVDFFYKEEITVEVTTKLNQVSAEILDK